MKQDWRWIDQRVLLLLHDESLAEHGGLPGIRSEALLESALSRPQNLAAYGEPDIAELAACYAFGLAKNHPFADGNKRAAFLSIGLFLFANGFRLTATQPDATAAMLAVAAGEMKETELAAWIRVNLTVKKKAAKRSPSKSERAKL